MRGLAFVFLIAVITPAIAAEALSPQTQALVAPIHAAYQEIEKRHAALPPPKDDTERLIRMGEIDQAVRGGIFQKIDLSSIPLSERQGASDEIWAEIGAHDEANQNALKSILPSDGWFLKSVYGQDAVQAAWNIVQHAVYDRPWRHNILASMEPLVSKGEISAQAYGMLYDSVAFHDGKPQRYGSLLICEEHKWMVAPLEDPAHVDPWRRTMGFPQTVEENFKRITQGRPDYC